MEVYKMSWREFQLRSIGFQRKEKNDWIKVREIAYNCLIGSHLDPKKLPKTKERYMPLDNKEHPKISEKQKNMFINAFKNYLNERKTKF
jgi:hypothetical protein